MQSVKNSGFQNLWKLLLLIVAAYLPVYSMGILMAMMKVSSEFYGVALWGNQFFPIAFFGMDFYLLRRFLADGEKRRRIYSSVFGFLFSLLLVWGTYAHFENDIFIDKATCFRQVLLIGGLSLITIPGWAFALRGIEKISNCINKHISAEESNRVVVFFQKHSGIYFGLMWLLMFFSFLPIFLVNWPGNFIFDSKYQMTEIVLNQYKTHHPLAHTLLMAAGYHIGKNISNVSLGLSFYVLLQMVIMSGSIAYFLWYLLKKKGNVYVQIIAFLFFLVLPMHQVFAISATKDVLCGGFFLVFMVYLVRLLWDEEKLNAFDYIGMVLSGTCTCLYRNNMLYALIAGALLSFLLLKKKKQILQYAILLVAIVVLAKAIDATLIHVVHAQKTDNFRESLSVPLQDLARVACYKKDSLPAETYDEICKYMNGEDIKKYNPYISDPVKNFANEELLKGNFVNFLKLWMKVGLKYPGEYVESLVTNTLGYWYPLPMAAFAGAEVATYTMDLELGNEFVKINYLPGFVSDLYSNLFFEKNYVNVPIMGFLFRNAIYAWTLVLLSSYCMEKKKWKGFLLLWIPIMYLGTCFLGPMPALRYMYPIVLSIPLLGYVLLDEG